MLNDEERELIYQLFDRKISKEEFLQKYSVDITKEPNYVYSLLKDVYIEKKALDVSLVLTVIFHFDLFNAEYVDILCELIKEPWHFDHENIAAIFQKIKSPKTVEILYQTALTKFGYQEHDDSYALAVKCIWALGDINTSESKAKLRLLSKSTNKIIKKNANYQLQRLKKM